MFGLLGGSRRRRKKGGSGKAKKRSGRRMSPAMKAQQRKMQNCAIEYKQDGKPGDYKKFMSSCLQEDAE